MSIKLIAILLIFGFIGFQISLGYFLAKFTVNASSPKPGETVEDYKERLKILEAQHIYETRKHEIAVEQYKQRGCPSEPLDEVDYVNQSRNR